MAYKNPEDALAYQRKWQAENREKMRAYNKKWRSANVETERDRTKQWFKDNPEYRKEYRKNHIKESRAAVNAFASKEENKLKRERKRLWDMYRITPEERKAIREYQANHEIYKLILGKNEGTDHSHKTGLIRGIMDWRINMAYGLLEKACPDLPAALRALAVFHENPPATIVLGAPRYGLMGLAKYKKKMIYGPPA